MQQQSNNVEKLQDFILQCKNRLNKILETLEWTEEGVLKNFNTNSVASSVTKKARRNCSPKICTYPESFISKNSLVLDSAKLQQLLQTNEVEAPRNFRELQANFSREQKLKIYEHVIENTEKLENNTVAQVGEGEVSLADIVAQKKREAKRKKRKFRKSKPTHIEEVRCLVDLQMQALEQFMDNKNEKKQPSIGQVDKEEDNGNRKCGLDIENCNVNRSRERDEYQSYRSRESEKQKNNKIDCLTLKYSRIRNRSRSKEPFYKDEKCSKSRGYEERQRERSLSKRIDHYYRKRSRTRSPYKRESKSDRRHEYYYDRLSETLKGNYSEDKFRHENRGYSHGDYRRGRRSTSRERSKYSKYEKAETNKHKETNSEEAINRKNSKHKKKKHKRDRS